MEFGKQKMPRSMEKLHYLLLQIRDVDDPIRSQEVDSFALCLGCDVGRISCRDLLAGPPSLADVRRHDVVFIGGSGRYSATSDEPWLHQTLDFLRELFESGTAVFASCWGFQAFSRALGGTVVTDPQHAELGTLSVSLTTAGSNDPVFGLPDVEFLAQMGHEDSVTMLPEEATLLAVSDRANQAIGFADRPVYATQFHSELNRNGLLQRVRAYPDYIHKITGETFEEFDRRCEDTPAASSLMRRFVEHVFDA
jgi:GMP synthase (glutamine-hydrolysing)